MNNVLQMHELNLSYLKQTHLVGLMSFTRDQFAASFSTEKPAPTKLQAQIAAFNKAYADLDTAYRADTYSLDTDELKAADKECDSIFMSIKKMVQAQQGFDFNPELKAAANRLMQAIDKFGIDVSEDYLGENNKLQQLLQEIAQSTQLTADAKALGLEAALAQLKEKATLVRDLLTSRGLAKAPKGRMKQARQAVEDEYRQLIQLLNAYALVDDDEHRFDSLLNLLNQNIDYLKTTVLARGGKAAQEEPNNGGNANSGGNNNPGGNNNSGGNNNPGVTPGYQDSNDDDVPTGPEL
jgi:hypothetical protein